MVILILLSTTHITSYINIGQRWWSNEDMKWTFWLILIATVKQQDDLGLHSIKYWFSGIALVQLVRYVFDEELICLYSRWRLYTQPWNYTINIHLMYWIIKITSPSTEQLKLTTSSPNSRYRLRSSQSNQLVVPPVKLSTYGPRSFAVAGPTIWNSLPEYLRDPELSIDSFRSQLKTFPFSQYWRRHSSALETFVPSCSINLLFTLHYIYITNPSTDHYHCLNCPVQQNL